MCSQQIPNTANMSDPGYPAAAVRARCGCKKSYYASKLGAWIMMIQRHVQRLKPYLAGTPGTVRESDITSNCQLLQQQCIS